MEAFGPYMEALGTLIKMDKHGAELENTGPALRIDVNHILSFFDKSVESA